MAAPYCINGNTYKTENEDHEAILTQLTQQWHTIASLEIQADCGVEDELQYTPETQATTFKKHIQNKAHRKTRKAEAWRFWDRR